jgi:hypothetical protein
VLRVATLEPVAMSMSLVSRSINPPIATVMTATAIERSSPGVGDLADRLGDRRHRNLNP